MEIRGKRPQIAPDVFVASSADIIGDVVIGEESSVWFQCVLRGDVMPIRIGRKTNIQDGTVIHGTFNEYGVTIGDEVTVGHKAMLHGCEVGDQCLIGMGAILLDGVKVGSQSFVAAGSVLTPGKEFPSGVLIKGAPAKVARPLKENELAFLKKSAQNYIHYQTWYKEKG